MKYWTYTTKHQMLLRKPFMTGKKDNLQSDISVHITHDFVFCWTLLALLQKHCPIKTSIVVVRKAINKGIV